MSIINFSFFLFQILFLSVKFVASFRSVESFNSTITGFEEFVWESIGDGKMAESYLTYNQYLDKITILREKYHNLIQLETIGMTYNNNNITAVKIKSKYHANKAILFTGMHHGREPTSFMMNLYIIHKIIFLNNLNDTSTRDLLDSVNIYFVPIINIDAYKQNVDNYFEFSGDLSKCMIRKNRNREPQEIFSNCVDHENFDKITPGVDLNRNYGYMFNHDDAGSSGIPCQDDYRGTHAFSEPETRAIKNFIESYPEIKIAINYHSWGNLFIYPFNYADSAESAMKLFTNYTFYKHIYDEFVEEAKFPKNFLYGNGMDTIKYKANGEASDWMLGEKNIISFSPELGIDDYDSNKFYLKKQTLQKVLRENLSSALYAISRASFYFQFYNMKKIFSDCQLVKSMSYKFLGKNGEDLQDEKLCHDDFYKFSSQLELKNKGFSDFKGETEFEILIDNQILEYISIKINSGYNSMILVDNKNSKNESISDGKSFGNPNNQIIFEKLYNRTKKGGENLSNDYKLINMDEIEVPTQQGNFNPNLDIATFKILFVESFNHVLIDIKFYINKKVFLLFQKYLIDQNYNETHSFYRIKRRSISSDGENNDYLLENFKLKYSSPEYKIKFKDFEYFNIRNETKPSSNLNKYESELRNFYKYVINSVLIGLIILACIFLIKLRGNDNLIITGQEEVIEEVIDEVVSDPSNRLPKEKTTGMNKYIELHNVP